MISSYAKRGIIQHFWNNVVRPAVLQRDNHKCTKCESKKYLEVHEEDYNNIIFDTLKTLCNSCHKKEHPHYNVNPREINKNDGK